MARKFCAVFLMLLFLPIACSKTLDRDVKALKEMKGSLGWKVGNAWTGDDPCGDGDIAWIGITCSPPEEGQCRVVTEVTFSTSWLSPLLPKLDESQELIQAMMMGPFPIAVTNLLDLRRLDLHGNKLTGVIPPEIGRLTQLTFLNLRGNKLQDTVPAEIGQLKQLRSLFLSFNILRGAIPTELAQLKLLRYLYINENRFTGRVPTELGKLSELLHLDVSNNHLYGNIKDLIAVDGRFPALRVLYLNDNQFTGPIPAQISRLRELEILYLSHNKLSGALPEALATLSKLTYLYVDGNSLSGEIPSAFYRHPVLKEIYLYDKEWSGLFNYELTAIVPD